MKFVVVFCWVEVDEVCGGFFCRVAVEIMRQLLGSLQAVGLALAKAPDPDSSFSVVVNGCEDDGINSFDASVFVLRLNTGSTNQPMFHLQSSEGVGICGVVASVAAAR